MATGHIAWVSLGAGSRVDGPENCIKEVLSAEAISYGGDPGTASGVAPASANAAIVRAIDTASYARKGTTSSAATAVYIVAGGAEVFQVVPGDKICLSTS